MIARLIYSLFTLYMVAILLRWLAPYLELDVYSKRLKPLAAVTDPVIQAIRRLLPPLGPADLSPPATLLLVWLLREVSLGMFLASG